MNDFVLEQRVSTVETNLTRLERKMDIYGKDSHEHLTRLEDWLIQYSMKTQGFIEESQRWRQSMEESRLKSEQEMRDLRQIVTENQQRTEQGFKELRQELAESQERLAESQEKNDIGFKELRQKIADSRKELGQISHRLGTVVEDLVAPSLPRILRETISCPNEEVLINVRVRRRHPIEKGKVLEIDAIADCGHYVLFNETKSQFTPEKVKAFLEKLAKVREYFPEYQSHQIMGCIASLYLDQSLIKYAGRQGLLALASGEYLMTCQNVAGFQWKNF